MNLTRTDNPEGTTKYFHKAGLKFAQEFLEKNNTDPGYLAQQLEILKEDLERLPDPTPYETLGPYKVLPAWRIGRWKGSQGQVKAFITNYHNCLLNTDTREIFVLERNYDREPKFWLNPFPIETPFGLKEIPAENMDGHPQRFSKPSLNAIRGWEVFCRKALADETAKNDIIKKRILETFQRVCRKYKDVKVITRNGEYVTAFSVVIGPLEHIFNANEETGTFYRSYHINIPTVPSAADILG